MTRLKSRLIVSMNVNFEVFYMALISSDIIMIRFIIFLSYCNVPTDPMSSVLSWNVHGSPPPCERYLLPYVGQLSICVRPGLICSSAIQTSEVSSINPYKPGVLFVGHRQTMQTQIRCHPTRRLSLLTECSIEI